MAARTSAGTGVVVTIALLSITSMALFITTVLFFGQMRAKENELADANSRMNDLATVSERDSARLQTWIQLAKSERESFVGYMLGSYRDAMVQSIGQPEATPVEFTERASTMLDGEAASMAALVRRLNSEVTDLTQRTDAAEAGRQAAIDEVESADRRIRLIEERHRETIDNLRAEIDRYRGDIDDYTTRLGDYEGDLDDRFAELRAEREEERTRLTGQLAEARNQILILRDQLRTLRGETDQFGPSDEAALVDGEILGRNNASGTVELSIGARDKVQVGMSFSVYATGADIRLNRATGEYATPKGTVEVIRVQDTTATARVLRSQPGNPILRGDVIANPLYDPNKVYTFLVYGLFDTNADGRATEFERDSLNAMITGWGGQHVDDLIGSLDFLVLGQRPAIPPEPPVGAPIVVIEEYIRQREQAQRYDDLFDQARSTAIPVLNENRLYTLLGKAPGEVR